MIRIWRLGAKVLIAASSTALGADITDRHQNPLDISRIEPYGRFAVQGRREEFAAPAGTGLNQNGERRKYSASYNAHGKNGNNWLFYVNRDSERFQVGGDLEVKAEVSASVNAESTLTYTLPGSDIDPIVQYFLARTLMGDSPDALLDELPATLNIEGAPPELTGQIVNQLRKRLSDLPPPSSMLMLDPSAIPASEDIQASLDVAVRLNADAKLEYARAMAATDRESLELVIGLPVTFRPKGAERKGQNHLFIGVKEQVDTIFMAVSARASCTITMDQSGYTQLIESEIEELRAKLLDNADCRTYDENGFQTVRWNYKVGVLGFGRATRNGDFRILVSTSPLGESPEPQITGDDISDSGRKWGKADLRDVDLSGRICTEQSRFCTAMSMQLITAAGKAARFGSGFEMEGRFRDNELGYSARIDANVGSALVQDQLSFGRRNLKGSFHVAVGRLRLITANPGYGKERYNQSVQETATEENTQTEQLDSGYATRQDRLSTEFSGVSEFWRKKSRDGEEQEIPYLSFGQTRQTRRGRAISYGLTVYENSGSGLNMHIDGQRGNFGLDCRNLSIERSSDLDGGIKPPNAEIRECGLQFHRRFK